MPPPVPPDADTGYWLIVLYAALFGGAVGSFLNVVVYRLPNGLSLISPPSHCPTCKEPIRWYDNIPVFGWMMLGGKCRHCRCSIPIRYPLVEALTAAMFGELAVGGPFTAIEYPWRAVYWYHAMLLCTLLCSALIEVGGKRPPLRLFIPALAVGIVLPLMVALPWILAPYSSQSDWVNGLIRGAIGLAMGVLLGGLVWWIPFLRQKKLAQVEPGTAWPPVGLVSGLVCVGLFLGWEALLRIGATIGVLYVVLLLPRRVWPKLRIPWSVWLLVVTFVWMLVWILFYASLVWPFGRW